MNNIPNRQVMNDVLVQEAERDTDIVVMTSDSRGSAKLAEFGQKYPDRMIEVGIAEQNIVSIASGLAHSGKKVFAVSPAAFLSMRSIEQVKVDVAYSNTNVKLVGISGGVSYGELGMSHHSLQDFAVTRAIPNLQVLCPADRFETEAMFKALINSDQPAYIRLGRNPVEDSYDSADINFKLGKADIMRMGKDITILAIGEAVRSSLDAYDLLKDKGVSATVINVHSLKPFDTETIIPEIEKTGYVITVEEHSIYGGLGSTIAEVLSEHIDIKHRIIGFPDEDLVHGNSDELFSYYGLSGESIAKQVIDLIGK